MHSLSKNTMKKTIRSILVTVFFLLAIFIYSPSKSQAQQCDPNNTSECVYSCSLGEGVTKFQNGRYSTPSIKKCDGNDKCGNSRDPDVCRGLMTNGNCQLCEHKNPSLVGGRKYWCPGDGDQYKSSGGCDVYCGCGNADQNNCYESGNGLNAPASSTPGIECKNIQVDVTLNGAHKWNCRSEDGKPYTACNPLAQCGQACTGNQESSNCAAGLICVPADNNSNGEKFCSKPEYKGACSGNPNVTTCCQNTKNVSCGQQCNLFYDGTDNCKAGFECTSATNGRNYCTVPAYRNACNTNPSQSSCCSTSTSTPTPTPTPTPAQCGQVCANFGNGLSNCSNGLVCVGDALGKTSYCSLPGNTSRCSQDPTTFNCCQNSTPTPPSNQYACGGISPNVSNPGINQNVNFTCAKVTLPKGFAYNVSTYDFRIGYKPKNGNSSFSFKSLAASSKGSNVSKTYTVRNYGDYSAQCRVCFTNGSCTPWGNPNSI